MTVPSSCFGMFTTTHHVSLARVNRVRVLGWLLSPSTSFASSYAHPAMKCPTSTASGLGIVPSSRCVKNSNRIRAIYCINVIYHHHYHHQSLNQDARWTSSCISPFHGSCPELTLRGRQCTAVFCGFHVFSPLPLLVITTPWGELLTNIDD